MIVTRQASFLPATANIEARSIEVVWSTGAGVVRSGGWNKEPYIEVLDLEGANLERFNNGAPVLNSHQSRTLSDQLGVVEKAWVEDNVGKAKIRFSSRQDVEPIFNDVATGIIRNVSIGYKINKEEREERENEPDILRVKEFELFELSFVPIPADSKAQTRHYEEKSTMLDKEKIAKEERCRVDEIRSLCKKFEVEEAIETELVDSGMNISNARERILDSLTTKNVTSPRIESGSLDETVTKRDAIANALEHRIDPSVPLTEQARQYHSHTLVDVARELINDSRNLSRSQIAERAFHSTSDFPKILGNLVNTTLMKSYDALVNTQNFRPLTRTATVRDFKPITRVRLGETPNFLPLPEGAEITYGSTGEAQEQFKIGSYGRGFSITRQAIINDSLDAFSDIKKWSYAAARLESKLFWDEFTSGVLVDKLPIFDPKHKNVAKTGAKLSVESLSEARIAMARHQGLDAREGDFLDITPKFLIVPIELATQAQQLMSHAYVPNMQDKINVFAGAYTIITDARLKDPNAWYLAASPDYIDIAEMIYLEGHVGPRVESKIDFETSALRIKATMDVGCKILDYRGLYMNKGV
jgi:HK97 family phage prohead protease